MLLSKAWASFEADKRIEGFSPQTLKAYLLQLSLLIDYFKDVEMELLDTIQLKRISRYIRQTFKTGQSCTSYPIYEIIFSLVP